MIVGDPSGRYLTAESAATAVDGLMDVIQVHGYAIGLQIPQRCMFCAQGQYKIVANGLRRKRSCS
jgi:hypothetical protein